MLPGLGLPSWSPPTFTPTGVLAWCLEDSGVGWVGVLNDGIWGDELFPPRSSALPGHQVPLAWPQPLSTQAACHPLLLPLLCRFMPGPEPHVNTASRWEVQATRGITILYIYEQWKVFPHLPPKSKVCFSSFNLQRLKIVLFKGIRGCTRIAQHPQSS